MPRSSAAAFTGSGFGPASGGQTTAAIVSPACSSPRSTSAANAAWPISRMRTSAVEMPVEEREQTTPGVDRRRLVVRAPLVAEEAVVGARVDDHLDVLP